MRANETFNCSNTNTSFKVRKKRLLSWNRSRQPKKCNFIIDLLVVTDKKSWVKVLISIFFGVRSCFHSNKLLFGVLNNGTWQTLLLIEMQTGWTDRHTILQCLMIFFCSFLLSDINSLQMFRDRSFEIFLKIILKKIFSGPGLTSKIF